MSDLLPMLLSAGVIGFVTSMISLWFGRRKTGAEVEKIIAETETLRQKAMYDIQTQLDDLRDSYDKLFQARELLRQELDRVHVELSQLRQELQSERSRNIFLQEENRELHKKVTGQLAEIKKQTGQLKLPARDGE